MHGGRLKTYRLSINILTVYRSIFIVNQYFGLNEGVRMQAMGKSSISSVVKKLLDVAWYLAGAGLCLATLMIVYTAVWGGFPGTIRVPITFELEAEAYQVASPALGVTGAVVDDIRAYLSFPLERGVFLFANLLILVGLLALAMLVLWQLRQVFRTLEDGAPFDAENARRIRWVGFAMILGEIFRASALGFWTYYAAARFESEQMYFGASLDFNLIAIIHGLVILVIAEVFRSGTRLEEDQSLTV